MSTLTKAVIRDALIKNIGLDKSEATDFVDDFFKEVSEALVSGDRVVMRQLYCATAPTNIQCHLG